MNAARRQTAAARDLAADADLSGQITAALAEDLAGSADELAAAEMRPGGGEPEPGTDGPEGATPDLSEAIAGWRAGLVELAGGSSLADVGLLGEAVIDLSAAHPSGVAQLFAGRPTRLSNLVREAGALPAARRRAQAVAARSAEHAQRYGVAPTYLAIGVATWTEHLEERPAPGRVGDDMEALARVTGRVPAGPGTTAVPGAASPGGAVRPARAFTGPVSVATVAAGAYRPSSGPAPRTPSGTSREQGEARVVRAPVLLRPVTLTPRGDAEADYDITLEAAAEINPVVARTLRAHGALIDPAALAQASFTAAGFDPTDVLDRISSLGGAVLEQFRLDRRVLVGTFVHPGQVLVDDLDELAPTLDRHEVVAAAGGIDEAVTRLGALELPEPRVGDANPARERGVGDLDPLQRHVVDALATGNHLFVDAPVGSDVAGTLAAVVAEANASGRSVLYVPGHRRAADALTARLEMLGLGGLLLDVAPTPSWRKIVSHRLLTAITDEADPVDTDTDARVRDALIGARSQLAGYIDALHEIREPWRTSAYDALQALARLTSQKPAPSTTVRLPSDTILGLTEEKRAGHARDLARAAELGAFSLKSSSSPWFGAQITTGRAARDALTRVKRLREKTLPRLREQIEYVVQVTGLVPAASLEQWAEQLAMLSGMRGTLDVFQPMVFERTVEDLVHATASSRWRAEHGVESGWLERRRNRKRAREMVRPGIRVPAMHEALLQVQEQREVWQAQCPRGGWPTLPEGFSAIEETYEAVRIDVEALEPAVAGSHAGGGLAVLDLDALLQRLESLAADAEALKNLPERTAILLRARGAGLAGLVDDLATRRVESAQVGAELELAWWSSVFEEILASEPALAAQDGAGLDALAGRFRELDVRHVDALPGPVRAAARAHLGAAMRDEREDAEALYTELIDGKLTSVRDMVTRHGAVARRLRPTMISTPTLVPHLLAPERGVDLVVLDAVQHVPLEVVVPAIARGRQVMVVGDPRSASGTAVRVLSDLLPRVSLVPEPSRRDPALTGLLAEHGYDGVLRPAPVPRTEALVHHWLVDGTGMPDPASGTVESTRAEVELVVELAIEHAMTRPEETFGVVTVTAAHADRIREALLAEVRTNPALTSFFSGKRPEPVVVADVTGVAGLQRDTIVFTLGFGRTPHGRVLHRFGVLGEAGGDGMLVGALGATRRRLHVVSCFGADDVDPERLRGPGPKLLREVLAFAAARNGTADDVELGNGVDVAREPDRLVGDLGERLWKAGLVVETDYGIGDGERIPLAVGHPDVPGELLVAVLTDDAAYVAEPSIRVRDRQLANRLERLGWVVAQVWSAAAFLDPDAEAERVRQVVLGVRDSRVGDVQEAVGVPLVVDE
ncbi:helicase [Myceligenerans cantabricum]